MELLKTVHKYNLFGAFCVILAPNRAYMGEKNIYLKGNAGATIRDSRKQQRRCILGRGTTPAPRTGAPHAVSAEIPPQARAAVGGGTLQAKQAPCISHATAQSRAAPQEIRRPAGGVKILRATPAATLTAAPFFIPPSL